MARKSTGKRQRFEIFKRDSFTCQYCGRTPPSVILEIDHITPVSKGGNNDDINLLTACFDCNHGKADKPLEQVPASLAAQIEEQKIRSQQIAEYNEFLMEMRQQKEGDVQKLGFYWYNFFKKKQDDWIFGSARTPTIKRFLSKIPFAEILNAMDIAHSRFPVYADDDIRTFKYFCGICWRTFKEQNGQN